MSNPAHLSEEEMRRIEQEELDAVRAVQAQQNEMKRHLAAQAYRQEVRLALRPRPLWWPVRWALPFLPVIAIALFLAFRPAPTPPFMDDTSGGISNSALMERCQEVLGSRLLEGNLAFPSQQEASGQFTANTDGKRWDSWVFRGWNNDKRTDFSCTFTAADNSVQVELIQEDSP